MLFTHMGKKDAGETKNSQDKYRPEPFDCRPVEPGDIAQPFFSVAEQNLPVFIKVV